MISGSGGDALKLTKTGSGTQTLTGANTYTGATTINEGTLKLEANGSISGSNSVTVAPGATLDASATGFNLGAGKLLTAGDATPANDVIGAVTSEGTIRPGGNGTLGTLAGITNLILGGTLEWDRSANSTASDAIAINGTLIIAASFNLIPAAVGFPTAGTRTYTVVSGLTSPLNQTDIDILPPLPADHVWNTSDPTALRIDHNQPGNNLVWTGNASGNWDSSSINWTGGSGVFQPGDFCTFDDTATGSTTVEIPADVEPGGIQVNNNATTYTIGSANTLGITGSTSLIKTGNGLLILTSSNIYSGGTMLTSGTLAFGDGALSTSGPITMNGGTLRWHGENIQDISAAITMVAGKTATFDTNGNQVVLNAGLGSSTTASLVKIGVGNLTLGGTGTWSGTTEVLAGTLTAGTNTALGAPDVLIGNGADDSAFMIANRSDISNFITVSASGTGKATLGADDSGTGLNAATCAGLVTLNRAATIFSAVPGDRLAIDGRITGNVGNLTVTGGSRTTFASTLNDFTGNVVVTGAGTVLQTSVGSPAEVIPDASNVTVDAGAFLQLASSSGAETINGLSGSGTVRSYVDLINPGAIFGSVLSVGGANGSASFIGTIVNGNGPLGLTKVGSGTQSLGGFNTYTGNTVVTAGTLHLLDDAAITFRVTDISHNTLTGAGTITLDGNFAIDVSAVTATTGSWQLESADTLTGAYGNSFQVVTPDGTPWTDVGGEKWTYSAGNLKFTFDETSGTLTVAEGGFASWIAKAEYSLDPADQDPTDDPDHDGVSNLVEYALDGHNPSVSDGVAGGFASGTLSFIKRPQAAADPKITYLVQESDDLGLTDVWAEAPAGPTYINTATIISYTLPTGKAMTFARLVVVHTP